MRHLTLGAVVCATLCLFAGEVQAKQEKKLVAPGMDRYGQFLRGDEALSEEQDLRRADQLRQKTIRSIRSLLKSKKLRAERRFELWLRLGELHIERHDYLMDQEFADYSQAHQAWRDKSGKGKEPQISRRGSKKELQLAINALRLIVQKYPRHSRADTALFTLGSTLARLGNETCRHYLNRLITRYPKSRWVPYAHLALGEFAFQRHEMVQAKNSYQAVLKHKKSRPYTYAVYKLGWAYYNYDARTDKDVRKYHRKAVAAFKLVVRLSGKKPSALRDEAVRDLILVWAEAGDVKSAWSYFRTINELDSFYQMLELLASNYAEQGKTDQAIAVYQRLVKEAPTRSSMPRTHEALLAQLDRAGHHKALVRTAQQMVDAYAKKSSWSRANPSLEVLAKAKEATEFSVRRYGTLFHQRGHKTKEKSFYQTASQLYDLYLKNFVKHSYDIRFYRAEALFELKSYRLAAIHYEAVALQENGKHREAAALAAVIARNQVVSQGPKPKLPPAGEVPQPIALTSAHAKLIEALDRFVAYFPKSDKGHPMQFSAAKMYYEFGHYDVATRRLEGIVRELPSTEQGRAALALLTGHYHRSGSWQQLETLARSSFQRMKKLDKAQRVKLMAYLKEAVFRRAQSLEPTSREEASQVYLAYYQEFPKDRDADKALYNAFLNLFAAGRMERAHKTGNLFLDRYPNSKMRRDALIKMAESHEALAYYHQAIEYYRSFAKDFRKDALAAKSLYNGIVIATGLNDLKLATSLMKDFEKLFPKSSLRPAALSAVASTAERANSHKTTIKMLGKLVPLQRDRDERLASEARIASIMAFHTSPTKGRRDLQALAKQVRGLKRDQATRARAILAESLFKLNEPSFLRHKATKITSARRLERDVARKQKSLEAQLKVYEGIITLGDPQFEVESLVKVGELNEDLAHALLSAPEPEAGSDAQVYEYKSSLEKVALPLLEEARQFYQTAADAARGASIMGPVVHRIHERLAASSAQTLNTPSQEQLQPLYMSHPLQWQKPIAELGE